MTIEQDLLIQDHLEVARLKSGKWANRQDILTFDECYSVACTALCNAAVTFKPSRGCHFVHYASICINNAIRNELKKELGVRKRISSADIEWQSEELPDIDIVDALALQQAVSKLPEDDGKFLELYMQGMTQRQLVNPKQPNQFAVHKRLHEIYEFIRHQMGS